MFPQPMSRSEFRPDDSHPDLTCVLEQNLLAGFPPDLALDLVLHELVVRAAKATRAGSAALALARGDELVCRAATGPLAPDLGVPLSTRDGLSGACLQTHRPPPSVDTASDPRVDPAATELSQRPPTAHAVPPEIVLPDVRINTVPSEFKPSARVPPAFPAPDAIADRSLPTRRPPSQPRPLEVWTLVVGTLAIVAALAVSFLIGSRIGWLRTSASSAQAEPLPTTFKSFE